jgi:hypothetical protein
MPWLLQKGDSLSPQSFLLAPRSTGGMLLASDFPPASQGGEQGLPRSPPLPGASRERSIPQALAKLETEVVHSPFIFCSIIVNPPERD